MRRKKNMRSKERKEALAPGRDYSLGTRTENNRGGANGSAITRMQRRVSTARARLGGGIGRTRVSRE